MSALTGRARVAWALCGLAVALGIVHTWLFFGWSAARENPSGWPVLTIGLSVWAVLGALIVTQRPGHRVGWLFIAGAVCSQLGNTLGTYDVIATAGPDPDPPAIWHTAIWLAIFLDVPEPLLFLILLFLLFPTGHLPSRRWRPLLWAAWVSFGLFVVLLAVAIPPWRIEPGDQEELLEPVVPLVLVLLVSMLLELLGAAASVVVRLRRAYGVERQQLRWLAVSAPMVAVSFVLAAALPFETGLGNWLRVLPLHLSVVAVVAGSALAILRYRLYDLEVVVSRAIILTVSTAVVAAGYTVLVVLVGSTLPARVSDAFWPSLLATAAVALAFQPLRRRIVRLADRLVFGARAAPYEALADFGRSLAQAPGPDDLLRGVAQAVSEATGAGRVSAVLELPGGGEVTAAWPLTEVDGAGQEPTVFAVSDRGERLGRVEVVMPPGRPLRSAEHALVEGLLAQSALAVRNLRLETELEGNVAELDRRTTELADSRRRLVVARDEEKARFAAALRRRVLPHLTPLPQRLVEAATGRATGTALDLQVERDAAATALDELRRLVRGAGPAGQGAAGQGAAGQGAAGQGAAGQGAAGQGAVGQQAAGQRAAADQAASSESGPNADLVT